MPALRGTSEMGQHWAVEKVSMEGKILQVADGYHFLMLNGGDPERIAHSVNKWWH